MNPDSKLTRYLGQLPADIQIEMVLPSLDLEILHPYLDGLRLNVCGTALDIYLTEDYATGDWILGFCPADQPDKLECLALIPVKHLVTLLRAYAHPPAAYLIVGLPDFTGGSPHVELAPDRESARQAIRDYALSLIEEGDPTEAVLDFDERSDGNMLARADYTAYAIPWSPDDAPAIAPAIAPTLLLPDTATLLYTPPEACPECGGGDLQLEGPQPITVIEDYADGARVNFEFPTAPADEWLGPVQAHCLDCGLEWEVEPDRVGLPGQRDLRQAAAQIISDLGDVFYDPDPAEVASGYDREALLADMTATVYTSLTRLYGCS